MFSFFFSKKKGKGELSKPVLLLDSRNFSSPGIEECNEWEGGNGGGLLWGNVE